MKWTAPAAGPLPVAALGQPEERPRESKRGGDERPEPGTIAGAVVS